jgi:Calcineurin-like phosphoesterase/Bacterial Ig domain
MARMLVVLLILVALLVLATPGSGHRSDWKVTQNIGAGDTLSGTFQWTVTKTTSTTMSSVSFRVDGTKRCRDTTSPWTCALDTRTLTNGQHTFSVLATAQDGHTTRDSDAATVSNGSSQPPPSSSDPVIAGAGDIAKDANDGEPTARLLDQINPTVVYTTGDNAYPDGTLAQYNAYYHPSWGRHKAKTKPTPGNHEYHTSGAAGYFAYFPVPAYYSYNLGSWHLVALNSEISVSAGSVQEQWLRNDLAATTKPCILAYWHKPRFSSGSNHGSASSMGPLWNALYARRADVVLNGHDHVYERFAKQNPSGQADPQGIRQFTVGTGGASHYGFSTPLPTSEVRNGNTFGVLKVTLHANGYDWQFVPVAGATFTDRGSNTCN